MQQEIDWRHLVGAAILIGLLVFAGFRIVNGPPELPRAQAPAGPNARMQDAPETSKGASGAALPTAH